ncbi:MAG TPA: M67 family metallopeptidase [Anaerolineales bacterium]|nr:M67 family metallopeptidase [Anaerolineales bacterium]
MMTRQLFIRRDQWQEMLDHVRQQIPMEACGLLAGRGERVEKVIVVRNQAQSPVRFVMDPYEQLKAFDWIESNGLELLGIFHSHPVGPGAVSETDMVEAAYEVVHIIWSQDDDRWQARGFWIENSRTTEVSLQIVE